MPRLLDFEGLFARSRGGQQAGFTAISGQIADKHVRPQTAQEDNE